jgi:hypothetical protein
MDENILPDRMKATPAWLAKCFPGDLEHDPRLLGRLAGRWKFLVTVFQTSLAMTICALQRTSDIASAVNIASLLTIALLVTMVGTSAAAASEAIIFADGFEDASTVRDLFKRDGSRWTNLQKTPSGNALALTTHPSHSATALHLYAIPSTSEVSKADIERALPDLVAGDRLSISAWIYAKRGQSLDNVFIFDLECHSCWPDTSPGIRVHLKGYDGTPVVERGKIGLASLRNEDVIRAAHFPREQWVHVEWHTTLSADELGQTSIKFDGRTVFSARGATFPDRAILARSGIALRKLAYERVQIGITANSSPNPVDLVVDTVEVRLAKATAAASR